MLEKFFKLKENGTTVSTEIMAGFTTFFAMSYILFVNPLILSQSGMPAQAVFLATIASAVTGSLIIGLFANVPYALAPGMGLNAFFTYTVCFALGFKWQEALAIVFLCGLINITLTLTNFRRKIIKAIPESLQHAISGGIGVFVAYVGLKNANLLQFTADSGAITAINGAAYNPDTVVQGVQSVAMNGGVVPSLTNFATPGTIVAVIGIVLTVILVIKNVRGAMLIAIIATTLIAIPFGVADFSHVSISFSSVANAFNDLKTTFGAAFGPDGFASLLATPSRYALVIMAVFAFSLSDTFDTIGTLIGTGRRAGIFNEEDVRAVDEGKGFKTKIQKALVADGFATTVGAIFGTSNATTFVESSAGIGVGGRTGLTSVTVAVLFLLSSFLAPIVSSVPAEALAPALIIVGMMMLGAFADIDWKDLSVAVPAFFSTVFMGLAYNISYGIGTGFIFYCIIKTIKGEAKDISPILWGVSALFLANFILLAIV